MGFSKLQIHQIKGFLDHAEKIRSVFALVQQAPPASLLAQGVACDNPERAIEDTLRRFGFPEERIRGFLDQLGRAAESTGNLSQVKFWVCEIVWNQMRRLGQSEIANTRRDLLIHQLQSLLHQVEKQRGGFREGRLAELEVAYYATKQGWIIASINEPWKGTDIDLILVKKGFWAGLTRRDRDLYAYVQVKNCQRTSTDPQHSCNLEKMVNWLEKAESYIREHSEEITDEFDSAGCRPVLGCGYWHVITFVFTNPEFANSGGVYQVIERLQRERSGYPIVIAQCLSKTEAGECEEVGYRLIGGRGGFDERQARRMACMLLGLPDN